MGLSLTLSLFDGGKVAKLNSLSEHTLFFPRKHVTVVETSPEIKIGVSENLYLSFSVMNMDMKQ